MPKEHLACAYLTLAIKRKYKYQTMSTYKSYINVKRKTTWSNKTYKSSIGNSPSYVKTPFSVSESFHKQWKNFWLHSRVLHYCTQEVPWNATIASQQLTTIVKTIPKFRLWIATPQEMHFRQFALKEFCKVLPERT